MSVCSIDALDYQPSTLEIARRLSAHYPEITFHEGDARAVAGEPGAYDFVFCSLALHHFNEDDASRSFCAAAANWPGSGSW